MARDDAGELGSRVVVRGYQPSGLGLLRALPPPSGFER